MAMPLGSTADHAPDSLASSAVPISGGECGISERTYDACAIRAPVFVYAAGRFLTGPLSTTFPGVASFSDVAFKCPRNSESRRLASSAFVSAPIKIASAVR
jgi:hypothetical protein